MSDLCAKRHLTPSLFYRWQREIFENGATAFERRGASGQVLIPPSLVGHCRARMPARGQERSQWRRSGPRV